ncbi:MAG TPA: carboxypeptidase-like regulatory domain-containing protein, partial [Terriglobia bacterium]|nr:carboxypeptidase-like regulatory domain-containing protein [Terriglobia bacterium]
MLSVRPRSVLLLAALIFTIGVSAWAQVSRGTITGIVTDPSGAVVPGVAVTIANTATGVKNNAVTNASGIYTVPLLPAGTYNVIAEKTGFRRYLHSNI